jgi:hypothetical protein
VPGYDSFEPLGEGTYGAVWKAREEGTGIWVAIKLFARGTGPQWQLLQEEVKQLAHLDSLPGIIQLKDVCPDADPPYYVMALADGGCLSERLEKEGTLPLPQALRLFRQACQALAYVHAKGIRHCDLKPGNVLLDACDNALLADFGQAHLSSDATPALGTFFYMAPEQASLDQQLPDTRWDVYGLGALFYTMLTGGPPRLDEAFRQELAGTANLSHRLARYREGLPRAPRPVGHRCVPGMDRDLAEIIDRCLDTDPARRLRDAGAVLEALKRRSRRRRYRPLFVFALVAPLLLLGPMALDAHRAGQRAVQDYQGELTAQLLETDRASAFRIALEVEKKLQDRIDRVLGAAGRAWQAARAGRPQVQRLLAELLRTEKFATAAVADRKGRLVAVCRLRQRGKRREEDQVEVLDPESLHREAGWQHFSFREWFCGEMGHHYEEGRHYRPISALHLSAPFVSSVPEDGPLVGIAVPLRDPSDSSAAPAGVLIASVKIDDLSGWFAPVTGGAGVVLLDRRGCCLHHPNPSYLPVRRGEPKMHPETRRQVDEALGADGTGTIPSYRDEIDGTDCLAGCARIGDLGRIGWVALVQRDRASAVERPVAKLRSKLGRWQVFLLAGLLTVGLWSWLFWTVRRAERLAGA